MDILSHHVERFHQLRVGVAEQRLRGLEVEEDCASTQEGLHVAAEAGGQEGLEVREQLPLAACPLDEGPGGYARINPAGGGLALPSCLYHVISLRAVRRKGRSQGSRSGSSTARPVEMR